MNTLEREKWILRHCIEYTCISPEWSELFSRISADLKECPNKNRLDEELHKQLVLHVVGPNMRRLWKCSGEYTPELLREPYLRKMQRQQLLTTILTQLHACIRKQAVARALEPQTIKAKKFMLSIASRCFQIYVTGESSASDDPIVRRGSVLNRDDDNIYGWFVVALLHRQTILPMLAMTPSVAVPAHPSLSHIGIKHESSYRPVTPLDFSKRVQSEAYAQMNHSALVDGAIEGEAIDISDNFMSLDMEKLCEKLQGTLLPESLRGPMWIHRVLRKEWYDRPESITWMLELERLGSERGMPADILAHTSPVTTAEELGRSTFLSNIGRDGSFGRKKAASVTDLARGAVQRMFAKGFPISFALAKERALPQNNSISHFSSGESYNSVRPNQRIVNCRPLKHNDPFVTTACKAAYNLYEQQFKSNPDDELSGFEPPPPPTNILQTNALPRTHKVPTVELPPRQCGKNNFRPFPSHFELMNEMAICRRAELLVRAAYILTGDINDRIASIALLLLMCFPASTPVSEKTLKFLMRIYTACLPSEQLHHKYNISSVAAAAFVLLSKEDPELYYHLQKYLESRDEGSVGIKTHRTSATSRSPRRPDVIQHENQSPRSKKAGGQFIHVIQPPGCYRLLRDWLETGFVGYVPEFAIFFIWDQLVMWGGKPRDWENIMPVLCCALLKLLRDKLLHARSEDELISCLSKEGRFLRSKLIFEEIRERLSVLPRNKWFSSPLKSIREDQILAVTNIQRLFRGRRARRKIRQLGDNMAQMLEDERAESDRRRKRWEEADNRRKREKILKDRQLHGEHPRNDDENSSQGDRTDVSTPIEEDSDDVIRQLLADIIFTIVVQAEPIQRATTPVQEELTNRTDETVYEAEEIDEEALLREIRERYSKEWNELRGIESDDIDDEINVDPIEENIAEDKETDLRDEGKDTEVKDEDKVTEVKDEEKGEDSGKEDDDAFPSDVPPSQPLSTRTLSGAPSTASPRTGTSSRRSSSLRRSSRRRSSVNPSGMLQGDDSDDEKVNKASQQFRETIPQTELDALVGFFTPLREEIHALMKEKRELKMKISEWKADFFRSNNRDASWVERKLSLGGVYDKYHEVTYGLRKAIKDLRNAEDELLRTWQEKKNRKK